MNIGGWWVALWRHLLELLSLVRPLGREVPKVEVGPHVQQVLQTLCLIKQEPRSHGTLERQGWKYLGGVLSHELIWRLKRNLVRVHSTPMSFKMIFEPLVAEAAHTFPAVSGVDALSQFTFFIVPLVAHIYMFHLLKVGCSLN